MPEPRTYFEIADHLGIPVCDRACQRTDPTMHRRGSAEMLVVHWAPRRITQRGLWNFLKLAARVKLGSEGAPEPIRSWQEASYAVALGHEIGRRFPREFADLDRARARAALATDKGQRVLDPKTRTYIINWSRTR